MKRLSISVRAMVGLAVGALVALLAGVGPASGVNDGGDPEWDYAENGPTTWADSFPTCGGDFQSPVDVQEVTAGEGGAELVFDYDRRSDVTVFNNSHTVEAEVEAGAGSIEVKIGDESKSYELLQFHFHTPSEHELSGYDQEAEMHLVHKAEDGSLAVVGVLFENGRRQSALTRIWRDLPDVDDEREIDVRHVPLRSLVPAKADAYHYVGSLTTPPCTENVDWFVLDRIDTMSRGQLRELRHIFSGLEFPSGNARPIQRTVVDDLDAVDLSRD
ncbi:MAG: carbonic anhydrase family protein [Actinomycetia bacterium]|nr:carbonic anhydrase family protein [Actinomycetes bacterium]